MRHGALCLGVEPLGFLLDLGDLGCLFWIEAGHLPGGWIVESAIEPLGLFADGIGVAGRELEVGAGAVLLLVLRVLVGLALPQYLAVLLDDVLGHDRALLGPASGQPGEIAASRLCLVPRPFRIVGLRPHLGHDRPGFDQLLADVVVIVRRQLRGQVVDHVGVGGHGFDVRVAHLVGFIEQAHFLQGVDLIRHPFGLLADLLGLLPVGQHVLSFFDLHAQGFIAEPAVFDVLAGLDRLAVVHEAKLRRIRIDDSHYSCPW